MSEEIEEGNDAYFRRMYAFSVGQVLTEADIADIQEVLKDFNEEIGKNVDLYSEAREAVFREIGGDELVAAAATVDEAIAQGACDKALARFYAPAQEYRTREQQRLDLAMLVRRIIRRHEVGLTLDAVIQDARDYLARNDLNGSPLRDGEPHDLQKAVANGDTK